MKKTNLIVLTLITGLFLLSSMKCRKDQVPPKQPVVEKLPPATQEGKNTCGFLVNGKVWLPKGRVGNGEPNLKWWYDPLYHNGTFNINGFRYDTTEGTRFSDFVVAIDSFSSPGIYRLNVIPGRVAEYGNLNRSCVYYKVDTIRNHDSYVNITKFDQQNHIIAGTFEFTLAKPGCDTVRITEGRFDIKF